MAGGVALNCVANGKLVKEAIFDNIWIQPAAGDAGGAIGAAFAGHYLFEQQDRMPEPGDGMSGAYLGPCFSQEDIEQRLAAAGGRFSVLSDAALIGTTAQALADGNAVGW